MNLKHPKEEGYSYILYKWHFGVSWVSFFNIVAIFGPKYPIELPPCCSSTSRPSGLVTRKVGALSHFELVRDSGPDDGESSLDGILPGFSLPP